MTPKVELDDLVTRAEIAEILDVSPQRVHQLLAQPGFPRSIGSVGKQEVWHRRDIERWSEIPRPPGRRTVKD